MQGKLQELTEKLYSEGVAKANSEAEQILSEAKVKAEDLLKEARSEANQLKAQADREMAELKRNVESELKLASQQAISALKDRITRLITAQITDAPVSQAMSEVEFVKQLVSAVIENAGGELAGLRLDLPASMEEKLGDYAKSGTLAKLGAGLELEFDKNLSGGFRVGPAGEGFVISFTDEGFVEFFRDYLRPQTRSFLFGEEG